MENIINYAITNHLTIQQLSDYLITHKEYDDKQVATILNQYIDYLISSTNILSDNFNINI